MFSLIASDLAKRRDVEGERPGLRLRWLFDPGCCATVIVRLSTGCHARGWRRPARFFAALLYLVFKLQLDPATRIGPRLMLRRAMGVVIVGAPTIGADVVFSEVVSIGEYSLHAAPSPTIVGDGVVIEPGTYVVAGSSVGARCLIGANCVVSGHVPALHSVTGAGIRPLTPDDDTVVGSRDDHVSPETRVTLRGMLSLIRSDLERRAHSNQKPFSRVLIELPLSPAALAILGYRIGHFCWQHRLRWLAHLIRLNSVLLLGSDIHPAARIGPALFMSHSFSTTVGPGVRLAEKVFLCPHSSVDCRAASTTATAKYPVIGSNTFLGDRSCVLGASRVGDGSLLGSTATVLDTAFGADLLVVGSPATSRPLEGRFDGPESPEPERPNADDIAAAGQTRTWRQTLALIRSDRGAWRTDLDPLLHPPLTPGMKTFAKAGQLILRVQNHLHARGFVALARTLFMFNMAVFGFEMIQGITIGPRFRMTGCFGSIVRGELVFGADVCMGNNMSLGGNIGKTGMPVIGDGVILRSGTSVYGPVHVGAGTILGLNAVLMRSVPGDVYSDGRTTTPLT